MLKTAASFVLVSSKSSTYPRGYAFGFDSPAALLDDLFEHPVLTRMMKTPSNGVLGHTSPCDVPKGYASVAVFPAALLHGVLIILRPGWTTF
jgi:hypothetical protein